MGLSGCMVAGGKGEEKAWNSWAESAGGGRDRGFRVEGGKAGGPTADGLI